MPLSFKPKIEIWCFSFATSKAEKLFVDVRYVMNDNKTSVEKLQAEQRLQIHTALLSSGSPWDNEMFKQETWYQELYALQ